MKKIIEDLLSYIWEHRKFPQQLQTIGGKDLEVIHQGTLNKDSGPDFSGARIKLENTLWAGNVEIHIKTSNWLKHRHQNNEAYKSVILHVVYEHDTDIEEHFDKIPVIELKPYINKEYIDTYYSLVSSSSWIPCSNILKSLKHIFVKPWLGKLLKERLERKTDQIRKLMDSNNMCWEETFYQWIASAMGFRLNNDAFLLLARSIPLRIILWHRTNRFQTEALLFGQSGLIPINSSEEYPSALKKEYSFLKTKYSLTPINATTWKFMRTRPGNFPTVRIAQFADILTRISSLLSEILGSADLITIRKILSADASSYWTNHYSFGGSTSSKSINTMGKQATDSLIINVVIPFIYLYGNFHKQHSRIENAIRILEQTDPEDNSIIRKWKSFHIHAENASETQALLELHSSYCTLKKCLSCSIGATLFPDIS